MQGFRIIVFESAVADQLAVEAAVVAIVDLLGHEAVQRGTDFDTGLVDVHGEMRGSAAQTEVGKQPCETGESHATDFAARTGQNFIRLTPRRKSRKHPRVDAPVSMGFMLTHVCG